MKSKVYLDSNATTQIDPRVVSIMIEDLSSFPANPSSQHSFGQKAKQKLLQAREKIANYCKVKPSEILFTSGGTESMNFLIKGLLNPLEKPHVITSNIEHACIQKTLQELENQGCEVSYLKAGLAGACSTDHIRTAIKSNTKLLVFSAVNSETGVKQNLKELSLLAEENKIPLVIDAVALLGKEHFTIPSGITGMAFSSHKCHGPKGVGFVFLRAKTKIHPLLSGGGQEYGLRSGTENLTGILGCAKAIELLEQELPNATKQMENLRSHFEESLLQLFPFIQINGQKERICNVSNLAFPGINAETLLIQLDLQGILASQGSACSSGSLEPSRVLIEMGLSSLLAQSSVRFSFNRNTTFEDISYTIDILSKIIPKLL